jgi:hypothetical protein
MAERTGDAGGEGGGSIESCGERRWTELGLRTSYHVPGAPRT